MELSNFLAISQNFIDFTVSGIESISLDWLGSIISWLFDLFSNFYGAVALGVIVFTLCLKTLVLPLDIYSRVKTKKQSLLMERMRPQMEKLQKQYENDKNMYQQKVMELQKANGYNPLGACLPMIISLVIFMVVFGAFSTYSNYATLMTYNNLVDAYNDSVQTYIYATYDEEEAKSLLNLEEGKNPEKVSLTVNGDTADYYIVNIKTEEINEDNFLIRIKDSAGSGSFVVDFDKFTDYYSAVNKEFKVADFNGMTEAQKFEVVGDYVRLNSREASAEYYKEHRKETAFGWIGNMWYPDSMLNREMPAFADFSKSVSRAVGTSLGATYEESYNEVTFNLGAEKDTYNGYFVLIVLAIGLMFLQQFIMMRSQKAANELSTVDGSAASTNKWMMIIMPIMFGFFSFFYSAAFSVYMIVNTAYGLISTLIINKIVTVRFDKKQISYGGSGGRVTDRKRLK